MPGRIDPTSPPNTGGEETKATKTNEQRKKGGVKPIVQGHSSGAAIENAKATLERFIRELNKLPDLDKLKELGIGLDTTGDKMKGREELQKYVKGNLSVEQLLTDINGGKISETALDDVTNQLITQYQAVQPGPGSEKLANMTLAALIAWISQILLKGQKELNAARAETLGVQQKLNIKLVAKMAQHMLSAAKERRDAEFMKIGAEACESVAKSLFQLAPSIGGAVGALASGVGTLLLAVKGGLAAAVAQKGYGASGEDITARIEEKSTDSISRAEAATEQKMQSTTAKFFDLLDSFIRTFIAIKQAL